MQKGDYNQKAFVFKLITNSFKISDGIYSEQLGYEGKKFIEDNTCEFLEYFNHKKCFSVSDLKTWSDICILEISLDFDETDKEHINKPIDDFIGKLLSNSNYCTTEERKTLNDFISFLKASWSDFLIYTD